MKVGIPPSALRIGRSIVAAYNPSVSPSASHLPLHKGGFGWWACFDDVPSMGVGGDTIYRPTFFPRRVREPAQTPKQPSNTHQHSQARESLELHEGSQQPARTCDGSGRRQIPKPFFGAGKRACVVLSMVRGCPQDTAETRGSCPPPRKTADQRDLTKGSVSRFLPTLF